MFSFPLKCFVCDFNPSKHFPYLFWLIYGYRNGNFAVYLGKVNVFELRKRHFAIGIQHWMITEMPHEENEAWRESSLFKEIIWCAQKIYNPARTKQQYRTIRLNDTIWNFLLFSVLYSIFAAWPPVPDVQAAPMRKSGRKPFDGIVQLKAITFSDKTINFRWFPSWHQKRDEWTKNRPFGKARHGVNAKF